MFSALISLCAYIMHLFLCLFTTPRSSVEVYCKRTEFNTRVLRKCKNSLADLQSPPPNLREIQVDQYGGDRPLPAFTSESSYKCTPYLYNYHLHTISAVKARLDRGVKYHRELISTPDRGTLSIDWSTDVSYSDTTPTIVILHGLTGGSHEEYVQYLVQHANQTMGFRSVVCNYRGCANTPVTSARGYCAANTEDFKQGLAHVRSKIPNAPLFAVGFSLGSIILTKYLSEVGKDSPFVCHVCVSNPFDLGLSSRKLENSFVDFQIYGKKMARSLKRITRRFYEASPYNSAGLELDIEKINKIKTLRDFDEIITCKTFGYKTPDQYYKEAGSAQYVPVLAKPTLFVCAIDDPLIDPEAIPFHSFMHSEHSTLLLTSHGGHLGFMEGWFPFNKVAYSDRVICDYFAAVWEELTNRKYCD